MASEALSISKALFRLAPEPSFYVRWSRIRPDGVIRVSAIQCLYANSVGSLALSANILALSSLGPPTLEGACGAVNQKRSKLLIQQLTVKEIYDESRGRVSTKKSHQLRYNEIEKILINNNRKLFCVPGAWQLTLKRLLWPEHQFQFRSWISTTNGGTFLI